MGRVREWMGPAETDSNCASSPSLEEVAEASEEWEVMAAMCRPCPFVAEMCKAGRRMECRWCP